MDFRQEFIEFAVTQMCSLRRIQDQGGPAVAVFLQRRPVQRWCGAGRLAEFYAKAITASGIVVDGLFGPAYKGIPLVAVIAVALARVDATCRSRSIARKPRITAKAAASWVRRSPVGC
jgi:orotate phosphoribosyltransferase